MSTADPTPTPPSNEELKQAFKKRLKVTRLDAESQFTRNPLSTGRGSGIVAITPPSQFAQAVWDELVKQGKLKKSGHGMYELAQE